MKWFQMVNEEELFVIDKLIDQGSQTAGELDYNIVTSLYKWVEHFVQKFRLKEMPYCKIKQGNEVLINCFYQLTPISNKLFYIPEKA